MTREKTHGPSPKVRRRCSASTQKEAVRRDLPQGVKETLFPEDAERVTGGETCFPVCAVRVTGGQTWFPDSTERVTGGLTWFPVCTVRVTGGTSGASESVTGRAGR